jgi:hypothetical protein
MANCHTEASHTGESSDGRSEGIKSAKLAAFTNSNSDWFQLEVQFADVQRIPEPTVGGAVKRLSGHRIPRDHQVLAEPILGGLHHEYPLEWIAA